KLGDGSIEGTDVGPIINESQRANIERYVAVGKKEGAICVLGGERAEDGDLKRGWFYKPTIFINVLPDSTIAQQEIFGPVLSVIKCSSLKEAIEITNSVEYGLSSSLYTKNINDALLAVRDIEVGICYINAPTIGAEAHMPFGGVKS